MGGRDVCVETAGPDLHAECLAPPFRPAEPVLVAARPLHKGPRVRVRRGERAWVRLTCVRVRLQLPPRNTCLATSAPTSPKHRVGNHQTSNLLPCALHFDSFPPACLSFNYSSPSPSPYSHKHNPALLLSLSPLATHTNMPSEPDPSTQASRLPPPPHA